jgi:hypothetical protein
MSKKKGRGRWTRHAAREVIQRNEPRSVDAVVCERQGGT